jgi:hypothetical protein
MIKTDLPFVMVRPHSMPQGIVSIRTAQIRLMPGQYETMFGKEKVLRLTYWGQPLRRTLLITRCQEWRVRNVTVIELTGLTENLGYAEVDVLTCSHDLEPSPRFTFKPNYQRYLTELH